MYVQLMLLQLLYLAGNLWYLYETFVIHNFYFSKSGLKGKMNYKKKINKFVTKYEQKPKR